MSYVVLVEFRVHVERLSAFMPLMLENARRSLEREPDCRQFDVCIDPSDDGVILLYEAYKHRAAFDEHLATEHFKRFNEQTSSMIAEKSVRTFARVEQ